MATSLTDRLPIERIQAEAHKVHLGRALLTLLVGVFWLLGWLVGKATLAIGFAWAASKVGFEEARHTSEAGPHGRAP
jgi:hypothetical protein